MTAEFRQYFGLSSQIFWNNIINHTSYRLLCMQQQLVVLSKQRNHNIKFIFLLFRCPIYVFHINQGKRSSFLFCGCNDAISSSSINDAINGSSSSIYTITLFLIDFLFFVDIMVVVVIEKRITCYNIATTAVVFIIIMVLI